MLSEYDSVAVALSQLDDWHTVPLVTLTDFSVSVVSCAADVI